MNEDILKSQWKQMRGQIKEWWSVLTDDDLNKINGQRDRLIGLLQQKYGFTKEQAKCVEISERECFSCFNQVGIL